MNLRRGILVCFVSMVVSLCLLLWEYPWSIYQGTFTFGWRITLVSYFLLALIIGLVEGTLVSVLSLLKQMRPFGQATLTGVSSAIFLFAGSIALGPGGADLFGTRIGGIFFAEWKFAIFDLEAALPISILSASIVWMVVRRGIRGVRSAS